MNENNELLDGKNIEILESMQNKGERQEDLLALSNGVVIKGKKVPPLLMAEVESKYPTPPVPEVYDEEKGRSIRNPANPDYIAAVEANEAAKSIALMKIVLCLGIEVVEVPDYIPTVDDPSWSEGFDYLLGEKIPDAGIGRLFAWLKYVIFNDTKDLENATKLAMSQLGVSAVDVEEAARTFRD